MKKPRVAESAYIADSAVICGDVSIAEDCIVLFNASIRADLAPITVGKGSNIQDNCVLHCSPGRELVIGERVSVGHGAILHGCRVEDNVIIGMGAIVMNGAVIGENSIVAAGALVTQEKVIPPGSMVMGSPAKVTRPLSEKELENLASNAEHYNQLRLQYLAGEHEFYKG